MKSPVTCIALIAIALVALSGCTSLSTAPTAKVLGSNPSQIAGLFYYLPEGRIHAVGTPGKDPGAPFSITISADIVPDYNASYFIKRDCNYVYDDVIDLKTDSNGLLMSGNVTSTDETANIVGAIASLVHPLNVTPPIPKPLKAFDIIFYPNGITSTAGALKFSDAVTRLRDCGFELTQPGVTFSPDAHPSPFVKPAQYTRITPSDFVDGVAFRVGKPCPIAINSLSGWDGTISASKTLLLPDPSTTYYLDYSRMPFVAKKTNLSFSNGMLTEFDQEVPSPINGFLGIPKAIIQAIVPIPGTSAAAPSASGAGKSTSASKS